MAVHESYIKVLEDFLLPVHLVCYILATYLGSYRSRNIPLLRDRPGFRLATDGTTTRDKEATLEAVGMSNSLDSESVCHCSAAIVRMPVQQSQEKMEYQQRSDSF